MRVLLDSSSASSSGSSLLFALSNTIQYIPLIPSSSVVDKQDKGIDGVGKVGGDVVVDGIVGGLELVKRTIEGVAEINAVSLHPTLPLCTILSLKTLHILSLPTLSTLATITLPKRATTAVIRDIVWEEKTDKTTVVIVGDKTGDVKCYTVPPSPSTPSQSRHLLSHTASIITTLLHLPSPPPSNDVLITGDRDEKILIHNFPDSYVLKGCVVEHEVYVTSVDAAMGKGVSGDGEGNVSCWNYGGGEDYKNKGVRVKVGDKGVGAVKILNDCRNAVYAVDGKGGGFGVLDLCDGIVAEGVCKEVEEGWRGGRVIGLTVIEGGREGRIAVLVDVAPHVRLYCYKEVEKSVKFEEMVLSGVGEVEGVNGTLCEGDGNKYGKEGEGEEGDSSGFKKVKKNVVVKGRTNDKLKATDGGGGGDGGGKRQKV